MLARGDFKTVQIKKFKKRHIRVYDMTGFLPSLEDISGLQLEL